MFETLANLRGQVDDAEGREEGQEGHHAHDQRHVADGVVANVLFVRKVLGVEACFLDEIIRGLVHLRLERAVTLALPDGSVVGLFEPFGHVPRLIFDQLVHFAIAEVVQLFCGIVEHESFELFEVFFA